MSIEEAQDVGGVTSLFFPYKGGKFYHVFLPTAPPHPFPPLRNRSASLSLRSLLTPSFVSSSLEKHVFARPYTTMIRDTLTSPSAKRRLKISDTSRHSVYEALYHKKGLDSAQFDTALLASPPRKENAIPPGCAQTSPPQTTPRRRTLTLSNVDSHSGSVNTSNARPSPPFPERTPSLTTSITTSGSDDDVCPVTPPIIAGNLDIFDVGVFTPPESPSFRVADSRVIPEKEARLSRDVDDVAIPAATRSKAAGLPFHLYYSDPKRPVMTPMYRTKPKGWSSLFIPPARRVTHRRTNSSITGLDLRFKENPQGEGPRV
ncbi:hypothetical protein BDZ89DRAFT_1140848 [Hymenopellis radicata]|nr:hypothetical protein BDZ89DRAFT_1140848 [Hymenopellis radicata]